MRFIVWTAGLAFLAIGCLVGCSEEAAKDERKSPARVDGPPVVVEASVDATTVNVGDRVTYRVEVRARPGFLVDYPPVLEQFATQVLFEAGYWQDEPDRGGRSVRSMQIVLDPGVKPVLEIAPTTIRYRAEGSAEDAPWDTVSTEAITVEVSSVAVDMSEFREPDDLSTMPPLPDESASSRARWALWIAGGGLALLAVFWVALFRKKKERLLPPLPPHEIAQRELAHLESLGLLEQGKTQEYYYRLTAILRRYIELRFGIMAPERTTEEFLAEIQNDARLPDDQKAVLREFLAEADLVKYARQEPAPEESRRAWQIAERFVKVTIQHPGGPAVAAATEGGA
ncbi:MAG: hypothetical protein KDB53_18370 [Planctomycetes bacterium]|nr:hypothetical protein [Planctomycetota bacterium]